MQRRFNERRPGRFVLFGLMGLAALFVFNLIVMLLWNNALAVVLHISTVTFWQSLGILVLAKILFGGIGGRWGRRGSRQGAWRQKMFEKWEGMTPEERKKFKAQWRGHCGWKGQASTEQQGAATQEL